MDNDKTNFFGLKEWNGKYYPLVLRKKGTTKIDKCPFCGKQHTHTSGEGHRYTHCMVTPEFKKEIKIKGHVITSTEGYFIEEY